MKQALFLIAIFISAAVHSQITYADPLAYADPEILESLGLSEFADCEPCLSVFVDNRQHRELLQDSTYCYVYDLNSDSWENRSRSYNIYDSKNLWVQSLRQQWDPETLVWVNSSRGTYSYDALDRPVTSVSQSWNSAAGVWENDHRSTQSYTPFGKVQIFTIQIWNSVLADWESVWFVESTYLQDSVLSKNLSYGWGSDQQWHLSFKDTFFL